MGQFPGRLEKKKKCNVIQPGRHVTMRQRFDFVKVLLIWEQGKQAHLLSTTQLKRTFQKGKKNNVSFGQVCALDFVFLWTPPDVRAVFTRRPDSDGSNTLGSNPTCFHSLYIFRHFEFPGRNRRAGWPRPMQRPLARTGAPCDPPEYISCTETKCAIFDVNSHL